MTIFIMICLGVLTYYTINTNNIFNKEEEQEEKREEESPTLSELAQEETPENNEVKDNQPKKAIALLMRKPVDLPLWLKHHRDLGFGHFFIRVEDTPGLEEYLKTQSDITYEIADSDTQNNYDTLQTRQIAFVNKCINQSENISWIFHVDSDELIEGDLKFLDELPEEIKTLKMQNVEAIYDGSEKTCFDAKSFVKCFKSGSCRSYANGKAGGRCIKDEVQALGPHDFSYKGMHNGKHLYQIPFEQLRVLHYDSCSFGAWAEKFQHLSKKDSSESIPFNYYNESISIAASAYEAYKKHTMNTPENSEDVYTRGGSA
jgi:hypothetical protein